MSDPARTLNDPQPGQWMIRCCGDCPEVAARIWICSHEPGEPANRMDRPYLQGQVGLDLVPPTDIWTRRGRAISAADFERQIAWLRWAEKRRPDDPAVNYRKPVDRAAVPMPRFL